jgi:radical SAM superfamily enzyme YgiQ (UPF0313 family)
MRRPRKRAKGPTAVLDGEIGTIRKSAPSRIALGYPAAYPVAASSLGFQTVYRAWNELDDICCARFFAAGQGPLPRPLRTIEDNLPVAAARALAFSIACEGELTGLVRSLEAAGLEPLADDRSTTDPPVIVGGPLTALDPRLVAPLADLVVVSDAELALRPIAAALARTASRADFVAALLPTTPGLWIPSAVADPPPPAHAPVDLLPARAATWSPRAELKSLYLVEAARGCRHGCAFCVLSARGACAGGFRPVEIDRVLDAIPPNAPAVGLVGAAVTDHPQIEELVDRIVAMEKRVSLSSVRAERLSPTLVRALRRGGLRTLTLAADGASDSLRRSLRKGVSSADLTRASKTAADAGVKRIKLYAMVGLPGETDADIEELVALVDELGRQVKVAVAAQAFVPKPGTPLAAEPMAEPGLLRHRLRLLGRSLKGRARVIPTSPRWSWLDWKLAHGGTRSAIAAIRANELGSTFAAWKQAIQELGL